MNFYGRTQPPLGAMVDSHHSLASGLVACWVFNGVQDRWTTPMASRQQFVPNLVPYGPNARLDMPVSGGTKLDLNLIGGADQFVNGGIGCEDEGCEMWCGLSGRRAICGSAGSSYVLMPTVAAKKAITIVWRGRAIGNVGGINPSRILVSGTDSLVQTSWGIIGVTNSHTNVNFTNGIGGQTVTINNVFSTTYPNLIITLGLTYVQGDAVRAYVKGLLAGSTASTVTIRNAELIQIGNDNVSTGYNSNTTVSAVYIWDRALSPDEHMSLSVQPYAMFAGPVWRRTLSGIAAGATAPPPVVGKPWLYYAGMRA